MELALIPELADFQLSPWLVETQTPAFVPTNSLPPLTANVLTLRLKRPLLTSVQLWLWLSKRKTPKFLSPANKVSPFTASAVTGFLSLYLEKFGRPRLIGRQFIP